MTLADRLSTRSAFGLMKLVAERTAVVRAAKVAEDKARQHEALQRFNSCADFPTKNTKFSMLTRARNRSTERPVMHWPTG